MSAELETLITPAVVAEICRRSREGEGVVAVITSMDLPEQTIVWLRDHYQDDIVQAKKEQLRRKYARELAEKKAK